MFGRSKRRDKRDAAAADHVERSRAHAHATGLAVVRVLRVQRWYRSGTKAYVHREGESIARDAWIPGRRAVPDEMLLVREHVAWGWHTRRPGVLYVDSIETVVTANLVRRWDRRRSRATVAQRRIADRALRERRPPLVAAYDE